MDHPLIYPEEHFCSVKNAQVCFNPTQNNLPDTNPLLLWDSAKAVIRGQLIAISSAKGNTDWTGIRGTAQTSEVLRYEGENPNPDQ